MKYHVIPYEGEILYSQIARLLDHILERSASKALRDLFGQGHYKATIDLPNHLEFLFNHHYHQLEDSVDAVIRKHTLYSFYEAFLLNDKRQRILENLKRGSGASVHIIAGINTSNLKRNRYPRYCPQCILEERLQFHEAYWQRIHQVPGVLVCPVHNVFVNPFEPSLDELNHSMFISAERLSEEKLTIVRNENSTLLSMSRILNDVLHERYNFDINSVNYMEIIKKSNYMKGTLVNYMSLTADMVKYYGLEALNKYFPDYKDPLQWVASVIRRPTTYFDPTKHLFIHNFLSNVEYKTQLFIDPVWDGPWNCINGACQHYGKPSIQNADVFFDNTLKRTAAHVKCTCGMVYKISFTLKNGVKTPSFIIKDYGEIWRQQVLSLKEEGKSITAIAKELRIGFRAVDRFLNAKADTKSKLKDLAFQSKLTQSREKWTALLESFEEAKVVNARKSDNKLYKWLHNNDRPWMRITNKLHASPSRPQGLKLNWDMIDDELVSNISECYEELRKNDFGNRVTISLITKLIAREKNYFRINREKLPNAGALLERIVESTESYQTRRLKASIQDLAEKGQRLTLSKVVKNSGLKEVDDEEILGWLETEIKRAS